jgi:RNA polymerase sigma-70 factor (ECF subfamily)
MSRLDCGSRADERSLRELYHAHGPSLLGYLMRLTRGDRQRAEDMLQETLLRAWAHPEVQDEQGRWSRRWLYTVARRIAIDQQRAATARPTEFIDDRLDQRGHIGDGMEQRLDAGEVRAALASLPTKFREVLVEVYFKERALHEVAVTLGIPLGTVKSRTYYALRSLRKALEQRGFGTPRP